MSEPVVLRPQRSARWQAAWWLYSAAYLTLLSVLAGHLWLAAVTMSVAVVSFGWATLDVSRSRVVLTDDRIEHHRWRRRPVVLSRSELVGLSAPVAMRTRWRHGAPRRLVLRSTNAPARIRLAFPRWSDRDIGRVAEHAGVDQLAWIATPREFEERARGTMNRIELLPLSVQVLGYVLILASGMGVGLLIDHL